MVVIYWCMALPQRVGVGIAWLAGLLLDVVRDVLLGQYALTLAIIAFIVLRLHQRLRVFPLWQQAAVVAVLIVLQYFLVFWVRGTTGELPDFWLLLLPALGTFLLWPPTFLLLRNLRRRYQVT
jgi:rod shape-determining protein MreD